MAKKYFKSFGVRTFTEQFERHLFGTVAGIAKTNGCKAELVEFDDEATDGYVRVALTGTDDALNEVFYCLWERYNIKEWNAA